MRRARRLLVRVALVAALLAAAGRGAFELADRLWPFPLEKLEARAASPVLTDREGGVLFAAIAEDEQWRRPVPLEEISPWLIQATVAIEDRRFFEHSGVDVLAAFRAAGQNLLGGRVISGASTLTMQVAKMADPRPRTFRTKAIESFRALQLERLESKREILELYLNLAPYGGNLCGAECAALHYFGKHASQLSLTEATLLAGLPQSPARLRPAKYPERALERRGRVLAALEAERGIDATERRRAEDEPLALERAPLPRRAPHFSQLALARRPGGGRTTLDPELQATVEYLVADHRRELPEGADIAVVVIELASADLVALVGSADPDDPVDGQVNGATARRSPGSTLKPFVYAAAFEAGILAPDSKLSDRPIDLGGWTPRNYDESFSGEVTVTDALRRSLNVPALRAARRAGLHRVLGVLGACGIELPADAAASSGLALVTGATLVNLLELTNAYATLGRDGEFAPVRMFLDEAAPRTRVLRQETCEKLHAILDSRARFLLAQANAETEAEAAEDGDEREGDAERAAKHATEVSATRDAGLEPSRLASPLAGNPAAATLDPRPAIPASLPDANPFCWKTGTSSGHRDAWAVGHDERFAIGVWIGNFSGAGHPSFTGALTAEPLLVRLFGSRE